MNHITRNTEAAHRKIQRAIRNGIAKPSSALSVVMQEENNQPKKCEDERCVTTVTSAVRYQMRNSLIGPPQRI